MDPSRKQKWNSKVNNELMQEKFCPPFLFFFFWVGGWIGFFKSFQSQQIQIQYKQSKEIEFREFKLGFIVVRHFLAYVHSPQPPNRVKVPLTWSFNQTSNLLTLGFWLQWALTQPFQDSTLLKALTLRFLQDIIT